MANGRTCERCGAKASPHIPRRRAPHDGRMVCEGCFQALSRERPDTSKEARVATRKLAHDSGDGATIFHCPFCGSGQVIARSDRTTECEYCHTCFTVQVQPQFPAFPQTVDGMPMQVPGMPGQIGGPPGVPPAAPGMDPGMGDPAAAGGDPMDPEAGAEPPEDGEEDEGPDDGGDDAPPFAKGSMLRTASGAQLPIDSYVKHLAIKYADDKDAVIQRVREGR